MASGDYDSIFGNLPPRRLPGSPPRPAPPPNRSLQQTMFPVNPMEVAGGLQHLYAQGVGNAAAYMAGHPAPLPGTSYWTQPPSATQSADLFGRDITGIIDKPSEHISAKGAATTLAAAPLAFPLAKAAAKAAPEAEAVAQAAPAVQTATQVATAPAPGFTAYHGSPHTFDKFDINQIGTGEGAQAYGHGLYFADAEDTAKSYRPHGLTYEGAPVSQNWQNSALEFLDPKIYQQQGAQAAIAEAKTRMTDMADFYRKTNLDQGPNLYDNVLRRLNEVDPSKIGQAGSMYQVRINADRDAMIDLDRPMSGQNDPAYSALSQFAPSDADEPVKAMRWWDKSPQEALNLYDPKVTQQLQQAGIPGIKYLDQGSRDAGTGTSNYVMFNDNMIDILKRYGLIGAPLAAGGAAAGAMYQPSPLGSPGTQQQGNGGLGA